ncbi:MAG TPA: DUF6665 family protein [Anaeromyxobacteraceae bacterium]
MSVSETQTAIEQQLVKERAGSLAQAVEALEAALSALRHGGPRRSDLLEEAGERLWYVVVQREALGLTRHEVLYEVLRVPREVRGAMGPRPRR